MKLKYYIDSNKGITFAAILCLMAFYDQWHNPTAWIYLALHGSYGILWVLKSNLFPDQNWDKKTSVWFGLISWFSLTLYWVPAFLVTSQSIQAPIWLVALCISLYAFGIFFVFTADMQKFTALKSHPNELITDGMMSLSRNINYFGEFLIYTAFALLALSWIAFIPLTLFIITFWIPNIVRKERILAQLDGFEDYKKTTKIFIPYIF